MDIALVSRVLYSFSLLVTLIIFASCNGGGGGEPGGDSSSSGGAARVASVPLPTPKHGPSPKQFKRDQGAIKNDPTEAARAISSEELNAAQGEANLTEDDIALTSARGGIR